MKESGMGNISEKLLEEKIEKIVENKLKTKFGEIYREMLARFDIEEKILMISERLVKVEEAIKYQGELIEKLIHQFDKRFGQIDRRFEQVDRRFEQIDKRFEQVDKRFDQIDKRFNMLTWFMGIGFTLTISIIATILSVMLK